MSNISHLKLSEFKSDNQHFLFDTRTGDTYQLNNVALEIFNLLKEETEEKEIVKQLARKYHKGPEEVQIDLLEFKMSLKIYGLCP